MKSRIHLVLRTGVFAAVVLGGLSFADHADAASAFGRAAGKYPGTLKGKATTTLLGLGTISLPQTPATVKLPRGKGNLIFQLTLQGQKVRATGRITRATKKGRNVILKGRASVPASKTFGLGKISGPFTARVKLGPGNKETLKGSTRLAGGLFVVRGKFTGMKN